MGDLNWIQKGGKIKIFCAFLCKTGVIALIYLRHCIKTRRRRENSREHDQRRKSRRWTQISVRIVIVIVLGCMCDCLEITILVPQQHGDPRNEYGDIRDKYGDQLLPFLRALRICANA